MSPRGNSDEDMGDFGTNDVDVRGIAREFLASGHTKTGKVAEVWVLLSSYNRSSPTGSGDTVAPDICGQATGNRQQYRSGCPYVLS